MISAPAHGKPFPLRETIQTCKAIDFSGHRSHAEIERMNTYISLNNRQTLGRSRSADVRLSNPDVSREHLRIERIEGRFHAYDLTNTSPLDMAAKSGSRLNGKYFNESILVFGDRLAVGSYTFRFDGKGLLPIGAYAGATVKVQNLVKKVGEKTILDNISLEITRGNFVGILGTSGAGKSTFLDAISGIRPGTGGIVTIDGVEVEEFVRQSVSMSGYVPQSDIIHFELTVREAVWFSALLRLPSGIPYNIISDCVETTLKRLDLSHIANVQIAKISGGQQKRVSIATEILSRPFILFLDEPSSGLDPATEAKLMEQLRELANLGCTVVCTTHIMENVHSFDSLIILRAGKLIFQGSPAVARSHFEINRFATLYERIESRPVEFWCDQFIRTGFAPSDRASSEVERAPHVQTSKPNAFGLLIARQKALLFSDWKSPLLLVAQPIAIGTLLAWMAHTCSVMLFVSHLAAFWFGCSNASQEIVKESAIYRRERMIGVRRLDYLLAKGLFWTCIAWFQAGLLFFAMKLGAVEIEGDMNLQILSLAGTSVAAVAIGLAVSAWVKTATQATRAVPLILIPQIVLSGYVLPPVEKYGFKKVVAEVTPSHASQALMDTSLLWHETFDMRDVAVMEKLFPAHRNLSASKGIGQGEVVEERSLWTGELKKLSAWAFLGSLLTYAGLKRKEKE